MAQKKKTIRIDKLDPWLYEEGLKGLITPTRYELSPILKDISDNPRALTTKIIREDEYFFHICRYNAEHKVYEIQIVKPRDRLMPGKITIEGRYEIIRLPEGERLAESATLAYSPEKQAIYMQRNHHAIAPSVLAEYLKELTAEGGCFVQVRACVDRDAINKIDLTSQFKALFITVEGQERDETANSSFLESIWHISRNMNSDRTTLRIHAGRSKKKCLDREETIKEIKEIMLANRVTNLKAKVKHSHSRKAELIDLIEDRIGFDIQLPYSQEEPLTHERIFQEMLRQIKVTGI